MGIAALGRGDVDYAARVNEEALQILRLLKNKIGVAVALIQAAGVAFLRGHLARAARLFAAAQAVRRSIGHPDPVLKLLNYDYEAYIATAHSDPSQDYVVQCFLTDAASKLDHGEVSRLLDTALASTNDNGNARFSCTTSSPLLGQIPGQTVSAIATNIITGDTSEFSKNKGITTVA